MIISFKNNQSKMVFEGKYSKKISSSLCKIAYRKLVLLHAASDINDLRVPPGNRLEVLKGNRGGQHSIRINDQWRICFRCIDGNAFDVEIVDYH